MPLKHMKNANQMVIDAWFDMEQKSRTSRSFPEKRAAKAFLVQMNQLRVCARNDDKYRADAQLWDQYQLTVESVWIDGVEKFFVKGIKAEYLDAKPQVQLHVEHSPPPESLPPTTSIFDQDAKEDMFNKLLHITPVKKRE